MLPIEIICEIAVVDISTYSALVRALPTFARWCRKRPGWALNLFKTEHNGNTYLDGRLHSFDDKPAIIDERGTKFWYKNGQVHRGNDLPALITVGERLIEWHRHGNIHRDGKPAVIYGYTQEWWIDGMPMKRKNIL